MKVVVDGTVAIGKLPLKLASATPLIATAWPAVKPCGDVVVMVTTPFARTAPLGEEAMGTKLVKRFRIRDEPGVHPSA